MNIRNLFKSSLSKRVGLLRKAVILCLLLSGISSSVMQAQSQFEKLKKKANNKSLHDTIRVNAFIAISNLTRDTSLNYAINAAEEALNIARKADIKRFTAHALDNYATLMKFKGNFEAAESPYLEAKMIFEELKDSAGMALNYSHLGTFYQAKQQNQLAIYYLLRSLSMDEKFAVKDEKRIAATYNNIGNVYYTDKNYRKAQQYYYQALAMNVPTKNQRWEAINYLNLGNTYKDLNELDSAVEFYTKAIILGEELKITWIAAASKEGCGNCLLKQNHPEEALQMFESGLIQAKSFGNKEIELYLEAGLSDAYLATGQNEKARQHYQHCLDSAGAFNFSLLRSQLYLLGARIFEKEGNFAEANKLYRRYSELRDSSAALQNESMYRDFETRLQQEQEEHEKEIVRKQDEEKNIQEIRRNKIILVFVIIVLLLSVASGLIAYRSFRIKKKSAEELSVQNHIIEEKQKEILDSITYAKRLQEAILPSFESIDKALSDNFILYKPKDIVAGDFYWFEQLNGVSFIAAADCTGHGVPGALVSVVCSNALNRSVLEFGITDPGKILDKTRELVLETFSKSDKDVKDGMDISLCAIDGKNIRWAGAYNPVWYLSGGEMKEIRANKQPIGKTDNPLPFTTHHFLLEKGDIIYLFTDGYADQFGGEKGKKFKYKQLEEKLISIADSTMPEQKSVLDKTIEDWRGNLEQVDDVCIIGIRI